MFNLISIRNNRNVLFSKAKMIFFFFNNFEIDVKIYKMKIDYKYKAKDFVEGKVKLLD